MHFQRSKQSKRLIRSGLALIPLSVLVLGTIVGLGVPDMLTGLARMVAEPVWRVADSTRQLGTAFTLVSTDVQELAAERDELQRELMALRRSAAGSEAYQADNEALRILLGRSASGSGLVPAAVLRHETISLYDTFIIDIGHKDGVRDGMLIRASTGEALGYVVRTLERTATIARFSSPGLVTEAMIYGTSTVHTRLTGRGGGTMTMRLPTDLRATTGDAVLLPAFETIPVGTVVHIEHTPEDSLQTLYIRSLANTREERFVLVDSMTIWRTETDALNSEERTASDSQANL